MEAGAVGAVGRRENASANLSNGSEGAQVAQVSGHPHSVAQAPVRVVAKRGQASALAPLTDPGAP